MYNKDKTTISQNYWTYKNWPDDWKRRFMEFMKGKKKSATNLYLSASWKNHF